MPLSDTPSYLRTTPALAKPRRTRAFTLIELLAVITIVGILAGILIPVVSSVRTKAAQATCTQNLRSLGLAIQFYTNDNKGRLPGPLYYSQSPLLADPASDPKLHGFLINFIKPWLSASNGVKNNVCPEFVCPKTDYTLGQSEWSYTVAQQIWGKDQSPWGQKSSNGTPMTLMDLDSHYSRSRQWAIRDSFGTASTVPKTAFFSPKGEPRHGKTNVLYFDWHVTSE